MNKTILVLGLILISAIAASAQVIPTNEWVNFNGSVIFNGQPAPIGSVVDAYDPDGINCGSFIVGSIADTVGIYGFMPVYRDDDTSVAVDHGADPGDLISFKVNGRDATITAGDPTWTSNGATQTVDVDASGILGLSIVDNPLQNTGAPLDTIEFLVGVHNTGNITDLYGITVTSAQGWTIIYSADVYNLSDSIINVPFSVEIPLWGLDLQDTLDYTVFSRFDPTVADSGTVTLLKQLSDIDDDPYALLPGNFTLHQNYPNPFNPTTTISFDLAVRSTVRFEVFDVLGRTVDSRDLGDLGAQNHIVEFDASHLTSGIYFYRITTEFGADSRKMLLLK